jgi:hypothetical protein
MESNTEKTQFGQTAAGNKQPGDYDYIYIYRIDTQQRNILPPAKKAENTT